MNSETNPLKSTPSNIAPHEWISTLKNAVEKKRFLGKTSDSREIRQYGAKEEIPTGEKASMIDIYNFSKEIFSKASPNQKKEIAEHLTTLIDIKSTKLEDTIKKTNALWITALKVFMVVSAILIPITALVLIPAVAVIHLEQAKTTKKAQEKLTEMAALQTDVSKLDGLLLDEKKQIYTQEIRDIVDVMNHNKQSTEITLGQEGAVNILPLFATDNKSFAEEAKKNCKKNIEEAPVPNAPKDVVAQFYKDLDRNYVIHILEKNETGDKKKLESLYTNQTNNEAKKAWLNEHPNEKFEVSEFVQGVVNHLNKALGDDAARWSKPIQALCVQSSFIDVAALKVSRINNNWYDSNGIEHDLNVTFPTSFNILITRNQADPSKIEKVIVSLDTPITLNHFTQKSKPEEKIEELDLSLTYHLLMEVTLDEENEPQINVLRREFTKSLFKFL